MWIIFKASRFVSARLLGLYKMRQPKHGSLGVGGGGGVRRTWGMAVCRGVGDEVNVTSSVRSYRPPRYAHNLAQAVREVA